MNIPEPCMDAKFTCEEIFSESFDFPGTPYLILFYGGITHGAKEV